MLELYVYLHIKCNSSVNGGLRGLYGDRFKIIYRKYSLRNCSLCAYFSSVSVLTNMVGNGILVYGTNEAVSTSFKS